MEIPNTEALDQLAFDLAESLEEKVDFIFNNYSTDYGLDQVGMSTKEAKAQVYYLLRAQLKNCYD